MADTCEDCKTKDVATWFCLSCGSFLCADCHKRHETECDGDADSDEPFKHQDGKGKTK